MSKTEKYFVDEAKLDLLLGKFSQAKIGLLGDVCLDVYWFADMTKSEISRETPHFPLPIVEEKFSLGAAGNVAANITALQGRAIHSVVSVVGEDWRGYELGKICDSLGISKEGLVVSPEATTFAYCKPVRKGISAVEYEDPRLDFANYQPITEEVEDKIIENIKKMATEVDLIAVSDQFEYGCITPKVREVINQLGRSITIIVDSRDDASFYKNVIIKPNEVEAARIVGFNLLENDIEANLVKAGEIITKQTGKPVAITLGEQGSFYYNVRGSFIVPSVKVEPPIDFVGAGDTFLSAFALATAVGATGEEALSVGNLAAAVVIKKIGTTGTATIEEIKTTFLAKER